MQRSIAAALVLLLCLPLPSLADKRDKGKAKRKHKDASITVVFKADERERVRLYFVKKHGRGNCPPGLAKKNNSCLPPGHAKKRYFIGKPVPASVEIHPVPEDLIVLIDPAPAGHRYAIIDGDLVKLVVGTMLVVDAIEGLVN